MSVAGENTISCSFWGFKFVRGFISSFAKSKFGLKMKYHCDFFTKSYFLSLTCIVLVFVFVVAAAAVMKELKIPSTILSTYVMFRSWSVAGSIRLSYLR